tara:strand:+ start:260 stop:1396 length:1137 start_codon:yes stop_codon:yes gene_type:complete
MRIVDAGIIYVNPDPAYSHISAFYPNVVQLFENELLCVHQYGDGLYAPNNTLGVLRSTDGGKTWTNEGELHDRSKDDRPYSYMASFLSRMSDGTLTVSPFRIDRSNPRVRLFNDNAGLIDNDPILFISRDRGLSWSEPIVQKLPTDMNLTSAQALIELDDGKWMATFDQWPRFDDTDEYEPRMWCCTSGDGGQTWDQLTVMADGADEGKGYWHGRTTKLSDGRLFSLLWAADMTQIDKGPVNLTNHFTISDPSGRYWETPTATNLPGQTNCTVQLPDGRLAAIYTCRESSKLGFLVALSNDLGLTWDLENQVRVWDASNKTVIGFNSADKYPHSHDTIAFGAPSLITLANEELLATWWCTHMSLTHTRWAKLSTEGWL